jgi:hypothetical protein
MKDSAAPGEDGIPAEAYKYGGHDVKVFLLQIVGSGGGSAGLEERDNYTAP